MASSSRHSNNATNRPITLQPVGGDVLVGTTTDNASEGRLQVNGRISATGSGAGSGNGVTTGADPAFYVPSAAAATPHLFGFGSGSQVGLLRGYQDGGGTVRWQFGRVSSSTFTEQMRLSGSALSDTALSVYGTTASTSTITGSLVNSGGLGNAGAGYFGGNLSTAGSVAVNSTDFSQRLNVNGGARFSSASGSNAGGIILDQLGTSSGSRALFYDSAGSLRHTIDGGVADTTITSGASFSRSIIVHGGNAPSIGGVFGRRLFTSETLSSQRGYSALIAYGGPGLTATIKANPTGIAYGVAGVTGAAVENAGGGRTGIGVYGYGMQNVASAANSSNSPIGGVFLAEVGASQGISTGFSGSVTGTWSKADSTTGVATSTAVIVGLRAEALGRSTETTYGARLYASGAATNIGLSVETGVTRFYDHADFLRTDNTASRNVWFTTGGNRIWGIGQRAGDDLFHIYDGVNSASRVTLSTTTLTSAVNATVAKSNPTFSINASNAGGAAKQEFVTTSAGTHTIGATGANATSLLSNGGVANSLVINTQSNTHPVQIGTGGTARVNIDADSVAVTNTTASTSPTSGALTVAGGAGIGGDLNVAGDLTIAGAFSAPNYTAASGTLTGGNTGLTLNAGGTDQNIVLNPSGTGSVIFPSPVAITNSTGSTSPTTGALTVAGDVGLLGNLWLGGQLNMTGSQAIHGRLNSTASDARLEFLSNGSRAGLIGWTSTQFRLEADNGRIVSLVGPTSVFGPLYPSTDATSDLGITGTNRWRDLFLSGGVVSENGDVGFSIRKSSSVGRVWFSKTSAPAQTWQMGTSANDVSGRSFHIDDYTLGETRFMIAHTSGNVGIGTTAPTARLEVAGTLKVSGATRFDSAVRIAPQGDLSMGEFTVEPQ